MFFGQKFEGGRPYEKLFRHKSDVEYAHNVFRQLARELWGDCTSVAHLYGAYQKRLRCTYHQKFLEAEAAQAGLYNKQLQCASSTGLPLVVQPPVQEWVHFFDEQISRLFSAYPVKS